MADAFETLLLALLKEGPVRAWVWSPPPRR